MAIDTRKVLVALDRNNGTVKYRFTDWAEVATPLGSCAEPFCPLGRVVGDTSATASLPDTDDELGKVNDIKLVEDNERCWNHFNQIHGGLLMPRTERRVGI